MVSQSEINEKLSEGYIRAIITFEIVGKPKKHIEAALSAYLKNLHKDSRLIFINEESAEAIALDDGLFSTFSEIEVLVKDLTTLNWIAVNFSPASIEVVEPSHLEFGANDLTGWLNDLIAKLHELGATYRESNFKVKSLTESLNALITNFILSLSEDGAHDLVFFQKKTGIHKDQLKPFVEHLEKKGKLVRVGDGWRKS